MKIQDALTWIEEHVKPNEAVAVLTDSQSLCVALTQLELTLDPMRMRINAIPSRFTIQ